MTFSQHNTTAFTAVGCFNMFFFSWMTYSHPANQQPKGKQLAVLSPGWSPIMSHTESENETEAVTLVCGEMRRWSFSRPLPLKFSGLTALISVNPDYSAVSMLMTHTLSQSDWHILSKVWPDTVGIKPQTSTVSVLQSLSNDCSSVQYRWMSCVTIRQLFTCIQTLNYNHIVF